MKRRVRGQPVAAVFECPLAYHLYNLTMGCVDSNNREAQTTYRGQFRCFRVWKHIFFTLWHWVVYVAFALYQFARYTVNDKKGNPVYPNLGANPNKKFRLLLADELAAEQRAFYARSRKYGRKILKPISSVGVTVEEVVSHTAVPIRAIFRFAGRRAECAWCRKTLPPSKKGAARKHARKTSFGCAVCKLGLHTGACFVFYHEHLFQVDRTGHEEESQSESSASESEHAESDSAASESEGEAEGV